ncbi:MAG: xylulokinase [Deltaproteobacteria bacterium]|nr:xylulokinase [Deltaproteobacteria bacterium]MBI3390499.1 xylulokinase [Deltaproteobacteria bacterium]
MSLYLGFDVGTQGTKGVVLDAESHAVVARAGRSYGLIPNLPPGAAEQHPETWVQAVQEVAAELLAGVDRARVRGIGVSGQQHGLVVLDDHDRVVRPAKLWCDTTTAAEAHELSRDLGHAIPAGFTASKMLWLQRHEPEVWKRVRSVLLPHDYLNFRLTGRKTMEPGDASGTGFFDPVTRAFDQRALSRIDARLAEMLPPMIQSGEPAGALSSAGAQLLGLPDGMLVASGGGDNMMSAIGSGATRPGVVVVSLGTSGTAFAYSPTPVVDPDGSIAAFCDSTGGWLPLLCVMNMTGVTEEARAAFGDADHELLTREAAQVPAGCDGVMFLPYLRGERVPNLPGATGAIVGLRPGLLRRGHLFRAALEGTSLNLALGIERMQRLGITVDSVRVVGGGAHNPLWRQILADVLEVWVQRLTEPESAALGAAIQALWTVGRAAGESVSASEMAAPFVRTDSELVQPDATHLDVYREARANLRALTKRIFRAN